MDKRPELKVIDFAAFRAAHPRSAQPLLPFVTGQVRVMTPRDVAHRERMLRHLQELKFRSN
jgi:hypothetical protein